MKKIILIYSVVIITICKASATEGMWLPLLLEKLNEKEMRSLGMKIKASDIYSINKGSLKDAIVSFGGFCTGEVISEQGLVLTNHHCGFDAIQNHSTLEKNYIRDGFWAQNRQEELPNPGLFVTFIIRVEDVTDRVMKELVPELTESERQSIIDRHGQVLLKNIAKEPGQEAFIRPFFEGNQYYLFITETFRDVRLVGAPPSSVGNFGKDTDNWIWPRHTGDFSMFRIYASPENKPAEYSPNNQPYQPRRALTISLKGVKQDDFTMVFGFPGRTTEYLPSAAVRQIVDVLDPARITIRDHALAVIDKYMRQDEQIKIQYASKYAGISNAWKKWQGEVLGLKRTDGVGKKQIFESIFKKRVETNPILKTRYSGLVDSINQAYETIEPLALARDYFNEIVSKIELFTIANQFNGLLAVVDQATYAQRVMQVQNRLKELYHEYSPIVDKELFTALMHLYAQQPPSYIAPTFSAMLKDSEGQVSALADKIYSESHLDEAGYTLELLQKTPQEWTALIKSDPVLSLYANLLSTYQQNVQKSLNPSQAKINQLQRQYMQAQMVVFPERRFYPDANGTLRVTYGQVDGYRARDAVDFGFYTYLDGVMEKYKPGDYEFDVPDKLRELYLKKDFGPYGHQGRQPICFIATNHTTGGNSGSPALDARGNLIGLNFDRVWEGTMSDINYDASICRNIMVDIRYVLFIVDKYAGAGHLIREMKLVK